MPVTIRVVQMLPGPIPTFTESTPASASARAPARVATLPPISETFGYFCLIQLAAIEHACRVTVRRIEHQHVDARFDQRRNALVSIGARADAGSDTQPTEFVLAGVRIHARLVDVFDGDQSDQFEAIVRNQHFFDSVAMQQIADLFGVGAFTRGHQFVLARHHL